MYIVNAIPAVSIKVSVQSFCCKIYYQLLGIPAEIADLQNLETLNFFNNHIEVKYYNMPYLKVI